MLHIQRMVIYSVQGPDRRDFTRKQVRRMTKKLRRQERRITERGNE